MKKNETLVNVLKCVCNTTSMNESIHVLHSWLKVITIGVHVVYELLHYLMFLALLYRYIFRLGLSF